MGSKLTYDPVAFAKLVEELRQGRLAETAPLTGAVEQPREGDVTVLPAPGTPLHDTLLRLGEASLQRGELACVVVAGGAGTRFGGAVKDFQLDKYLTAKEARRMDEFMHYGIAAGVDAMSDAGLDLAKADLDRIGVITGSGIGGLSTIEETHNAYLEGNNPRKISPFFVPSTIINMISGHLSIRFGLRGPNLGVVTACTTSTHAVGIAMRTIQYGDADVVLAGGSEMATCALGPGGFGQAKAPEPFRNACTRYFEVEALVQETSDDDGQGKSSSKRRTGRQLKQDQKLMAQLRSAIDDSADDSGWANLSTVINVVRNQSSFEHKNFGYAKFSDLVRAIDVFEVSADNKLVRRKPAEKQTRRSNSR
jgi:hypothetical protein